MEQRKERIAQELERVRRRTLWLLERVPDEFLRRRVHGFYSPIGWHFGHVGRTEEYWICCAALGDDPCDEKLDFLFTDRPDNPKDNRVNIPDRTGILRFLDETRERALAALERVELDEQNPMLADGYAWEFAIQHECQHQETIGEMLQLIQKELPLAEVEASEWRSGHVAEFVTIPGGVFLMGSDDRHGYDNEKRAHEIEVPAFRLAKTQTTAFEWDAFLADGGYRRPELWSAEGWAWREAEGVEAPEYWVRQGAGWAYYGPFGARAVRPEEAVSSVSWYEAEAFARWSGKRLPTEAEWEYAATFGQSGERRYPWGDAVPTDELACFGLSNWGPADVGRHLAGRSRSGIDDMAGNVWEWTSSKFLPYPGFVAFPYDGYSKDHMDGRHFVCRGGSWATAGPILRRSFRNWYVPTYRQGFLGVRLAEDA